MIDYAWPHLELGIDCGGGTYIRSIARDIGEALGCGGLVQALAEPESARSRSTRPSMWGRSRLSRSLTSSAPRWMLSLACRGWPLVPVKSRRWSRGNGLRHETCRVNGTTLRANCAGRFRGEVDCPGRARSRSRLDSTSQGLGMNLRGEYLEPGARLPCPIRARSRWLKIGMRNDCSLTRI